MATITNVNNNNIITSRQTGVVINGTSLSGISNVDIIQGSVTVSQTIKSVTNSAITFDVVFDSGYLHLKYGTATISISNLTATINIIPPDLRDWVDIVLPDINVSGRLTTSPTDISAGDQIEITGVTGNGTTIGDVNLISDGSFDTNSNVVSFNYRVWDSNIGFWGNEATEILVTTKPSGKSAIAKTWNNPVVYGKRYSNPASIITVPTVSVITSTPTSITVSINGGTNSNSWLAQIKDSTASWGIIGISLVPGDQLYTFIGLTQNSNYDIRIKCANTYYNAYSTTVSSSTTINASSPIAPIITANTANTNSIPFTISGGSNATAWAVQYKLSSNSVWTTASTPISVGATSYTLNGLSASTAYDIRIHATNTFGSADSNVINLTTLSSSAPIVRVSGNKLVNGSGATLRIRGVNISGLENVYAGGYSTTNPWGTVTGFNYPRWDIIANWGVNAVRLPLNEASWNGGTYDLTNGQGTRNADPANNYRAVVKQTVDDLTALGWYVILELHFVSPSTTMPLWLQAMPNVTHSIPFWTSVAGVFGGYGNVMFDLFNEPNMSFPYSDWYNAGNGNNPWVAWKNGTSVTQYVTDAGNPTFTWQSAGMQAMVTAIRNAGANNVILLGGDNYAGLFRGPDNTVNSGWLGHLPTDPKNQLACSFHCYPDYNNQSQIKWGNTQTLGDLQAIYDAGYPIVFGEIGAFCTNPTDATTFSSVALPWAVAHNCATFAWAWDPIYNPQSFFNPVLVADANGTPNPQFGQIYHDWVLNGDVIFGSTPSNSAIKVSGNKLVNDSGQIIQMRGWNIAGNEYAPIQGWSPTDPSGGNSPPIHVYSDWKVNCVRIPLNEAAWNNTWTYDTDGKLHISDPGQNYRASIISQVAVAKAQNAYVILDLHWTSPSNIAPMQQDCMANYDNSIPFWTSVANTFKNDTSVMFELFNEPTLGQQNGTLQPARTGTATGGSTTTLVDSNQNWKINQFAGGTLKNTTTGDQSTIISNTPTTLTTTGNGGTTSGNGYQITAPFVTLMEGGYVDQAIGNSNNSTYKQINMMDLSAYTGVNLWPGDTISKGGTTATVISYDPTNSKVYFKDWSGSFTTGTGLTRTAGRKGATLISRSLSQAPSVLSGTAADLVSSNYNNRWRSSGTVNGQYCSFYIGDKVSAGLRNVTLFWMQDATYGFRPDLTGGGTYYNCPGSYQIRVNTAGAGARPTSNWYTIETITGNKYTKRMHTVSMTGDWKWVEIYFTASEGSAGNSDIEIKCDLYDSTYGLPNSVLIIGDSISANSLLYKNQGLATSAFPDLANAAGGWAAGDYPLMVNGGIPGWSCSNWLGIIDEVLTLFPTRFVEFAMGTNDSGDGTQGALTAWSANILTLSNKVKALGRTVLWDTIPYAADTQHGNNTVNYNNALAAVIASNPWIMNGVNRYALGNITQGSIDPIHPSDLGIAQLRSAYATFYSSLSLNITATISNAQAKWRIAGMQEMLNAVRATGATNVCMVSGNGWNDDLSGVFANMPRDLLTVPNLAVAWHPYPPTQRIETATIAVAGSGHAVGNVVTFARPSNACYGKASARITSVSGGAVTGIAFDNDDMRGLFLQNHLPTGNLTQESSTGGGTGLQISVSAWKNQGSQWSMPANWPTVRTIMDNYPLVCTETGEVSYNLANGSPWITDITNWADANGAGVIFWQINAAGWDPGENVLTKDKDGTPSDGYGVTAYNWLVGHSIVLIAPTLTVGSPSSTSIPFTISGGANATAWAVQYKLTTGTVWTTASTSISIGATSYTLSGLSASTTYDIRIHATNASGSADSNIINLTTLGTPTTSGVTLTPGIWANITPTIPNIATTYGTTWFDFLPSNPKVIYLTADTNGLWKTTDGGATWAQVGVNTGSYNFGLTTTYLDSPTRVRINPNDPTHLVATQGVRGATLGFWVSHDSGSTWTMPAGFNTIAQLSTRDVTTMEIDPADFNHILLGSHSAWANGQVPGVMETKDGGQTWTLHPGDASWGTGSLAIGFLYNPSLGIGNSNTWIVMTDGHGSWRTIDAGATWTKVSDYGIPHGGSALYYSATGAIYAGSTPYPLISTDNGVTWQQMTNGTNYSYYYSIGGDGTKIYTQVSYASQPGQNFPGLNPYLTANEGTTGPWTPYQNGAQLFDNGPFLMKFDSVNRIMYSANWRVGFWALKVL